MALPIVALVGRTNVGKSTLFNRLSSTTKSLTLDCAGVTRDSIKDRVFWLDTSFQLVDTGGITAYQERRQRDQLPENVVEKVREQALGVIDRAALILFVIDGVVGITEEDQALSRLLRKKGKRVIVVATKSDRLEVQEVLPTLYGLGYEQVIPVSGEHGLGINTLLDEIIRELALQGYSKKTSAQEQDAHAYRVVLLGRPNVGKSSLMNKLVQYERSIVADMPGTTREALCEPVTFYQQNILVTDTPGIRRKRAIDTKLETLMIKTAFRALKETDIVLLMIDGTEGVLVDQDLKLAFYGFDQQYKAVIILINKSDVMTADHEQLLAESFKQYAYLIKKIPVLTISCLTGKNIGKVLPLVQEVWQRYRSEWSATELTGLFIKALSTKKLVRLKRTLRLYRAYQVRSAPPTIVLEVNDPVLCDPAHQAFFENVLRAQYNLKGVPVRLLVKKYQHRTTDNYDTDQEDPELD